MTCNNWLDRIKHKQESNIFHCVICCITNVGMYVNHSDDKKIILNYKYCDRNQSFYEVEFLKVHLTIGKFPDDIVKFFLQLLLQWGNN